MKYNQNKVTISRGIELQKAVLPFSILPFLSWFQLTQELQVMGFTSPGIYVFVLFSWAAGTGKKKKKKKR